MRGCRMRATRNDVWLSRSWSPYDCATLATDPSSIQREAVGYTPHVGAQIAAGEYRVLELLEHGSTAMAAFSAFDRLLIRLSSWHKLIPSATGRTQLLRSRACVVNSSSTNRKIWIWA